jgi:hypothetical protein
VASEDIDLIPDDLPDQSRFLVSAVRAARRQLSKPTIDAAMDDLESMGFGSKWTLIWDGHNNAATFYPDGTTGDPEHTRYVIRPSAGTLTQDEVCEALNTAYNDNLKNPSAHTVRLWVKGQLVQTAEEEIERHLKGQLNLYFAAKSQRVKIIPQTNTNVGRTDLIFLQRPATGGSGGPQMVGVLELKVLRGPQKADWSVAQEGLSQGFYYRNDLQLPFATLALYDVGNPPSPDIAPLLANQDSKHASVVRARRFPIYQTAKEWRDAGGYTAP